MLIFYINGYIKDVHEAEDLMIEAFSQIFAKERPITGEGSFKAYLYKTAGGNRCIAPRSKRQNGRTVTILPFQSNKAGASQK